MNSDVDWKRRAEQAEQERHSALMDAGALRAALLKCYDALTPPIPDWLIEAATGQIGQQAMQEIAAALAERAELQAARAENAFLREWLRGELTLTDADIDAALKARR